MFGTQTWTRTVGLLLILLAIILVIVAPGLLAKHDPYSLNPLERLKPPSPQNWFGTDESGRDIYSRIVYGARLTIGLALLAICLSLLIGIVVGSLAGYLGGWVDELLMRFTDVMLAFPQLILAMVIVAALGHSMVNAMIGVCLVWWAQYARVMRAQVQVVKSQDFILAAVASGQSQIKIIVKHLLPNAITPVMVKATLDLGLIMLNLAALSFIGLGAKPPVAEWGAMIASGRQYLFNSWWVPTFPGLAIFVTVMSFNLLGDWIRKVLDPLER